MYDQPFYPYDGRQVVRPFCIGCHFPGRIAPLFHLCPLLSSCCTSSPLFYYSASSSCCWRSRRRCVLKVSRTYMSQRMVTCSGVGLSRFVELPSPVGMGAITVVFAVCCCCCCCGCCCVQGSERRLTGGGVLFLYSWVSILFALLDFCWNEITGRLE